MRTAMVRRVPRALTGFDEVKNSRSSDFSVALRWFLRSSELRYGSSGRIPQRSQAQSRKSTSEVSVVSVVEVSEYLRGRGWSEVEAGGGQCSLTIG